MITPCHKHITKNIAQIIVTANPYTFNAFSGNCSPEVMEMIKNDIIKVISKYMEIDTDGLDIQITSTESDSNNGSVPAIFANIPIKDMRNGENR